MTSGSRPSLSLSRTTCSNGGGGFSFKRSKMKISRKDDGTAIAAAATKIQAHFLTRPYFDMVNIPSLKSYPLGNG